MYVLPTHVKVNIKDAKERYKIKTEKILLKSSLILIYEVINARTYKGKWTENARNGTQRRKEKFPPRQKIMKLKSLKGKY